MTLVSVVLSPKAAYSGNAPPLRSPTPPGRLCTLGCSQLTVKCRSLQRWLCPLQKGISASSTSVSTVPCCGGPFHPVFSSLSVVIVPRVVVNCLCLWEEVSSESTCAAILTPIPLNFYSNFEFTNLLWFSCFTFNLGKIYIE